MEKWESGWFDREFRLALDDLETTSSVGICCLKSLGTTVGEVLKVGYDGVSRTYDSERVAILEAAVRVRMSDGVADPIRVFIKQEPHKLSKIRDGRFRLISAVSLVDTMVDRIMFGWLARRVLSTVGETPCMVGWSPIGGGSLLMGDLFKGKETRSLDMTAWDWTVDEWLIVALREVVKSLGILAPSWWCSWVDHRWESLFRDAIFEFGDGSRVSQSGWGIMKSGCFLTIVLNSVAQLLRHALVARRMGLRHRIVQVVMGDDQTLVNFPEFEEYERITLSLGYRLKPSTVDVGHVRFAGFRFEGRRAIPEYVSKHKYILSHAPLSSLPEILQSYQLLYLYDPDFFLVIVRLLAKYCPSRVLPRLTLMKIFNGS